MFSNEVDNDKEVPEKCCAFCCKILYQKAKCKLWMHHKTEVEEMFVNDQQYALARGSTVTDFKIITWPLLNTTTTMEIR